MTLLRFEDPPTRRAAPGTHAPTTRRGSVLKHRAIAAALRERPGEWALVGTYCRINSSSTMATRIKMGQLSAYRPAYAYDATARTIDGEYRLYIRYRAEDRITRRVDGNAFELTSGQLLIIGHRVTPALAGELRARGVLTEAAVIVPQRKEPV